MATETMQAADATFIRSIYIPKTHRPCTNAAEYRFTLEVCGETVDETHGTPNVERSQQSGLSQRTKSLAGYVCSRCAVELMKTAVHKGRNVALQKISIETQCSIAVNIDRT